jgi:hypothetical protein
MEMEMEEMAKNRRAYVSLSLTVIHFLSPTRSFFFFVFALVFFFFPR